MPAKIILTDTQIEIIKKLAMEGETKVNIAKAINRNRSVVDRVLKEFDIKLKPTSKNKKGKKFIWTKEKELKLQQLYKSKDYSLIDIANYFETS